MLRVRPHKVRRYGLCVKVRVREDANIASVNTNGITKREDLILGRLLGLVFTTV